MNSEKFNKAKFLFTEGMEYLKDNKYSSAEKKFLQSLNLLPERLSIVGNLFTIYFNTNNKIYLKNLLSRYEIYSNEKEILYGKAINYYFEENFNESIVTCEYLLKFDEINEFILELLALNFQKKKLYLKSLKILKKRLNKKKDSNIYYNLGNFFFEIGKPNQAFYYYEKSKKLKSFDKSNLWNLSLCALNLGKLELGFSLYENRWFKKTNTIKPKFSEITKPLNLNEIENKKILISDEQGLGDTIQFSRFVLDLLPYTKKITFVVNKKLFTLFKNLHNRITIIEYSNLKSNNFDYHISLFSLPNLLKIKKKKDINFYKLSINHNDKFELTSKSKVNVGICWSGNPNYSRDPYRSIEFNKVKNLILANKEIDFYKLSREITNSKKISLKNFPNLYDFGGKSLLEISQILNQFDLVVSTDTSIIHLAGILNIKSFLLLNYNSDWRWFLDTKKTIWYPSVTIIKQKKINCWDNVLSEFEQILKNTKIQKYIKDIRKNP